jgi:acetyl esterase/lipase
MRARVQALLLVAAAAAVARAQESEPPPVTPEEAELAEATFIAWPDRQYSDDADLPPETQCLDLFTPEEAPAAPLPVVVWIHGGGWQSGDKRGALEWKPACFTHAGFLLATVNYRLAPAFKYPAFMVDVARAIAWLRAHVGEYGGDPERIVLMGHSAGSHIAALLAADRHWFSDAGIAPPADPQPSNSQPSWLKGVVLVDGGGYDLGRRAQHDTDAENSIEMVFGKERSVWESASPVTHVAAGKNLPPFLLIHAGTQKATELEARQLARLLRRANVPVEQVEAPDQDHGTIQQVLGAPGDPTTAKVLEFVRGVTGAAAPAPKPKPKPKRHGPY